MVISPKTDVLAFLIQICILGHKPMKVLVALLRYHVFKQEFIIYIWRESVRRPYVLYKHTA